LIVDILLIAGMFFEFITDVIFVFIDFIMMVTIDFGDVKIVLLVMMRLMRVWMMIGRIKFILIFWIIFVLYHDFTFAVSIIVSIIGILLPSYPVSGSDDWRPASTGTGTTNAGGGSYYSSRRTS
jgi:hypothetical protein